jgi:hypothetical protein
MRCSSRAHVTTSNSGCSSGAMGGLCTAPVAAAAAACLASCRLGRGNGAGSCWRTSCCCCCWCCRLYWRRCRLLYRGGGVTACS